MAVLKKTLFPENLEKYSVLIQDTDPNSRYFKITELPDTFTGGKNAFLIQGSEFLVADTIVKIEIKDSQGNIIYHEPGEGIPEYYEGTSKVISVYVYPDTSFGPCTITILGEVSEYVDANGITQPVPLQYRDTYNVRWQKQINVNPLLQNNTKIRFYRRPQVEITEVLKPVFTISETYIQQSGNANLIPLSPSPGTHYDDWVASGQELNYQIKLAGGNTFTSNMLNQTMSFSSYPDYHPTIIEITAPTFAKLDTPLVENGFVNQIISTPYAVTYLSGSDKTQSEFTSSYAQIKLTQLETFAGDVKRVKVFRRSKGSISDFELVQDILLESTELLRTLEGTSRAIESTGIFDSNTLSKYWNVDGTLTATLSNSRVLNGVKLNGAGKFKYTSSLDLSARTVYELQFDAFYSASTATNLDIYISGSTDTNSSSLGEKLIGTLNGISPTKKFENQIIQFNLDVNEPSASLYFSASQGEWHLSDISLIVSQETAFSPDSVTFLTSIPTSVPNEIFEFKFEFYDVNNNFVPISVLEEKQFSGGTNTVIVLTQIASSSAEISSSLAAVSSSISGTITVNSSSISGTIGSVSASVSGSIFTLSGSVSGTIGSVSASVSGTIGQVSSSVSGTIGNVSASVSGTIGVLSGSVSGSIYTLSGSVSTSISNVSSSISSSLSTANSQSLYTVYSASAYLDQFIFTDANGKLKKPPTVSGNGLYTGDDHLGFYSGGSWKTYMDDQGDFYLTSSAAAGGFLAWSSAQGRLQIQGDINIQGGNAATNASLTSSLNAVSGAINSATQSLSSSVAATTFTTATGLIAKPPSVLVGSTSGLYLGSSFLGYYDGAGWKTFMANNGNFYLSGSGGDSLTWAGGVLSINGAINITGGNAATSAALTSSLSSTLSSANSTAQGYASNAALSASISGSVNASGQITKAATPSGAGLYLGSSYLGYYNGSSWKTYMENNGNFYLSGAGSDSLTWNGSTLTINGAITVTGGNAATSAALTSSLSSTLSTANSNAQGYASNAVLSGSASAAAAQTAAQLFATSIGNNAVLSGSAAASSAQTAAINQAKTDASASINLLANGNWTGGSGTFITATSISSPVIAGNGGYISGLFVVGNGGAITLDGINKKIYIGTGTHNNSNTSFYVDNSGKFSLKDKLVWDGTTLSITGNITVSGGNAATTSDVSTVSTAAANAQSTANTAVSNAATAQTTANNASTAATNAQNTANTKITAGGAAADVNSNTTTISGGKIRTGILESTGYSYSSGDFSTTGTQINLDNGLIRSKNFTISSAGDAKFRGDVEAINITATGTGNLAGWSLSSNALSKTTGSFTIKLNASSSPGITIQESNPVDTFDRLRINADLTIPPISVSDTGSINYSQGSQTLAFINEYSNPPYVNDQYGPVLGDGGSYDYGLGLFGVIGLQYASEEIFVEAENFPSISNVLSGDGGQGDALGYWDCYMTVRRYPTSADAVNQTNVDTTFGYLGEQQVLLASAYFEQIGANTPFEYANVYGGTIKAPGGGGINTPGTAKWYRVEITQYYYAYVSGNYSFVRVRRPSDMIVVKFGRVGNGYSVFSPGGVQVYQGIRNYMNAADVSSKAAGLDAEAAAALNFFEVKGKSGIIGSLSVSEGLTGKSKQFKIQHPTVENKWLYHTAIESPRADLIYRGNCELNDGFASCSIDSASRMTEGTFASFTKNPQLFLQNETGFDRVKGNVISGSVEIYSENNQSNDTISWLVVAERTDPAVSESPLYDRNGNYKPEKLKQEYFTNKIQYLKNLTSGSV